jgi:hypothetical protein
MEGCLARDADIKGRYLALLPAVALARPLARRVQLRLGEFILNIEASNFTSIELKYMTAILRRAEP